MTSRRTRTEVPYSASQMYDLVADVERYPEFLPWCAGLRVVKKDITNGHGALTADMLVAYKVFREKFRSHVNLNKSDYRIEVEYADGPFRHLQNLWRFEDQAQSGSIIDFEIHFEFKNVFLQTAAKVVFEKAFLRMSDAFIARAADVYGGNDAASQ